MADFDFLTFELGGVVFLCHIFFVILQVCWLDLLGLLG